MLLFWRIRYVDRNNRSFKDRDLSLDTESLPSAQRLAVELVAEADSLHATREILKFRSLFRNVLPGDLSNDMLQRAGMFKSFCLTDYFEDEEGNEIPPGALRQLLEPEEPAELQTAPPPKPIPLASVSLAPDQLRVLGYLTRDYRELRDSAFMKDGPASITFFGHTLPQSRDGPVVETAVTDDEIRSFVTIYRRLYMEKEPANITMAVAVFRDVIGDHPYAEVVSWCFNEYRKHLASVCRTWPPSRATKLTFTTKRLIDVFLYTQYAHQPSEQRQEQFNECLSEVHGDRRVLTWMFLHELWASSIHLCNVGRHIDEWFKQYCAYHAVAPNVLNSVRHEAIGFGALEKEQDRRDRLFREKIEELEVELWKQAGRPEGGPVQFRGDAREQLNRALQGNVPAAERD